ncbi:MAG: hypothetical protein EZS28_043613 [Streblomastix strix]|uniref:Uncharacterized protein n=2 Tax=Streblomastix strix TaxID=222440 RepID=A0A5J4TSA6_9EUKA|nr:MAG: hypothetical protein EZS28_043613 [Streblomastix strix]
MDLDGMTTGLRYRPLSTAKRILRSILQKYPLALHFTMQTDQMDTEETVAGSNCRLQPTKIDTQIIMQSITLAMKTITIKLMIIESEEMKTNKDPAMKIYMNKEYPNKDGPILFYPPKNYRLTQILRPKSPNHSEEQWNQFDGDVHEGVVPFCL